MLLLFWKQRHYDVPLVQERHYAIEKHTGAALRTLALFASV